MPATHYVVLSGPDFTNFWVIDLVSEVITGPRILKPVPSSCDVLPTRCFFFREALAQLDVKHEGVAPPPYAVEGRTMACVGEG